MMGFDGRTCNQQISRMISDYRIGGVILFERNTGSPKDIAALTNALQKKSHDIPLLIAIDQEGGRVNRLAPPFTQFPTQTCLGHYFNETHSVQYAYQFGEAIAEELKAVGISMNLAPVLDINTNPRNPVIGDRAFGSDPLTVSELGLAVIAGFQDNGILACGKHFPGHGDTSQDSHKTLPRVDHNLERLTQVEIKPFVHAIRNGLSCVMTAHVLYSGLDRRNPATLSEKIVNRLLRKVLGYSHIVMTDDLEMKAIEETYPIEEVAVEALRIGVDILLICHSHEKQVMAWEAVMKAVEKKRLSKDIILESVERIRSIKAYFLKNIKPVDVREALNIVGCAEHQEIARILRAYTGKNSLSTPLSAGTTHSLFDSRRSHRVKRSNSRLIKSSHPPSL